MHARDMPTEYEMTEHWLPGRHGPMRYWQSSPRHGLPVLLIHGYGALIEHWAAIMPVIAAHHTCYALDLYGFGYSADLNMPPNKRIWANQVAAFIHEVIPEPAVVVGHSLGGTMAAQMALDYPQFVRGLVLVDSTGLPETAALYAPQERAFLSLAQTPVVGELMATMLGGPLGVERFLHALYYRKERIRPEIITAISGTLRKPGAPLFRLNVLRAFSEFTLDLRPGDVTVPTLLLWGAEDSAFPAKLAPLMQERMFPHAEVRLIPESGHCPFDETPEAFCNALLPWIDELALLPA